MPYAIIAGTGIYDIPQQTLKQKVVCTPYGKATLLISQSDGGELIFLPRHGVNHAYPPHKINYRANIHALKQAGVKRVIAAYAVGGIASHIAPLDIGIVADVLDFTSGREHTFVEGGEGGVTHVEMSCPYCPVLSSQLRDRAHQFGLTLHTGLTYVATNGPRFETPAEIRFFRQIGADVVGMTGMPEVALAREAGMCFAGLALSINWAAGIRPNIEIKYDGLPDLRRRMLALCIEVLHDTNDESCVPARLI